MKLPDKLRAHLAKQSEGTKRPYMLFQTHCPECGHEGIGLQQMERPSLNLACPRCMCHTACIKLVLAAMVQGEVILSPAVETLKLTPDTKVTRY